MSHLDEGTLHALLDGELELSEVSEIQMHLGTCVACGSRLQEVKQVLAEADRLVGAMEVPAGTPRPRPEPAQTSSPRMPIRDPEPWNEPPPVLLVPDSFDAQARRNRWMRAMKWAAAVVVVVGAGKVISGAVGTSHPVLPERDLTTASPSVPPAVVSPVESRRADSQAAPVRAKPTRQLAQGRAQSPSAAKTTALAKPAAAGSAQSLKDESVPAAEDSAAAAVPADSQVLAAGESADTVGEPAVAEAGTADTAAEAKTRQDSLAPGSRPSEDLATRQAAAAALAELDRERRRERANAATAALPPPARPVQPAESDAVATPRTLEQRSQIYLRVGLDEAARQLGGPVHVIEGMSPQFIGLVRGQMVPGADPARPVVRVVYLDSRGRMILLDQQRTRAGQTPAAAGGNLRWVTGDVMLYLRGEPSPDILRSLQARVR